MELASTRLDAESALAATRFDLSILDVGLPDGSGLDICRHMRDDGDATPVLVLTARGSIADRVAGFDAGADDYLAKPFAPEELVVRVRALGRRGPRWKESVRHFGRLTVDAERHSVTRDGARIPLTRRELEIVVLLTERAGRVVPRDEIVECVWGDADGGAGATGASLDVLIARIRRKVDAGASESCIRTVRQLGYSWQLERSKVA